jgi:hypothetical protein
MSGYKRVWVVWVDMSCMSGMSGYGWVRVVWVGKSCMSGYEFSERLWVLWVGVWVSYQICVWEIYLYISIPNWILSRWWIEAEITRKPAVWPPPRWIKRGVRKAWVPPFIIWGGGGCVGGDLEGESRSQHIHPPAPPVPTLCRNRQKARQ